MKFLCDRMLIGLGKWLRAAGYDTAIAADSTEDAQLLKLAKDEARILLSCDRRLIGACSPWGQDIIVLATNRIDPAAQELTTRLSIDWLRQCFTRCIKDNSVLIPATYGEIKKVPRGPRELPGPILTCPFCHRLYWQGSHFRRMKHKLELFAASSSG